MKQKLLITLSAVFLALFLPATLSAQVLFSEDFDGVPGSTAGGPGTYSFPTGWFLRNVDNRTPAGAVSYVNEAWERREDFAYNVADSAAFSTSWYSPAGAADDWMWTPGIALPADVDSRVSWNAIAYDVDFRDGYEVRIMTVPPTGGTGSLGNMVSSSTVIFSTTAESASWTPHTVVLGPAYRGQTVYIGFRNNSNDKFLLLIDDVLVEGLGQVDASVTFGAPYEYTQYSQTQSPVFELWGAVTNVGGVTLTNANLVAAVYQDGNPTPVQVTTGTPVASLPSSAQASFNCGTFTPTEQGTYTVKYYPQMTQTEQNPVNDTLTKSFILTDTTMARDDNNFTGSLGIGAGEVGYLGQSFSINTLVDLTSISAAYTQGYTGRKYACVVWNTDAQGNPTTILASTDTLLYENNDAFSKVLPIYGGSVTLDPGRYVVTAVEFDSTLALATTDNIFTPGTVWVNWPSIPGGTWTNVETFGQAFEQTFVLRINLRTHGIIPVKLVSFTGVSLTKSNRLDWKVADQSNMKNYVLQRSSGGSSWSDIATLIANEANSFQYRYTDESPLKGDNYYRLKMVDQDGSFEYSNIVKLKNSFYFMRISPQPVQGVATLETNNLNLLNTNAVLMNELGVVVRRLNINALPYKLNVTDLPAGLYLLKLQDNTVLRIIKQ